MEFTITKEQIERLIKMAEHGNTNVIKADLKNWFPEAFKKELIVGKWYKHIKNDYLFCLTEINYNTYGYGIDEKRSWFSYTDKEGGCCACNSFHLKYLIEATKDEVQEALIAEAKKRGYKEGVTCIFGVAKDKRTISTNEIKWDPYWTDKGGLRMGMDIIFTDGTWAEILPEEKTTISKEKALKIIAKKLKVSPENIEIK